AYEVPKCLEFRRVLFRSLEVVGAGHLVVAAHRVEGDGGVFIGGDRIGDDVGDRIDGDGDVGGLVGAAVGDRVGEHRRAVVVGVRWEERRVGKGQGDRGVA